MASKEQLDELRRIIDEKTANFLDSGGVVTPIPVGKTGGPYGAPGSYDSEDDENDAKGHHDYRRGSVLFKTIG